LERRTESATAALVTRPAPPVLTKHGHECKYATQAPGTYTGARALMDLWFISAVMNDALPGGEGCEVIVESRNIGPG